MFKKRGLKGSIRSKPIKVNSDSSESEDDTEAVIKRPKVTKEETHKDATPEANTLTRNEDATKVDALNKELDAEELAKSATVDEPVDGLYKGQKGYATFLPPKSNAINKVGPKKASSSIRMSTVFDFARDECKDFRQTGFCGYGDSCKFVHARDDFKAGWKLNRDWDLSKQEEKEKEVEGIPFRCVLCKDSYKDPIKTKCGHYFCEKCFLDRSHKTKTCFICGKDTENVALPAKYLKHLLKER
jgi:RING finger protein 113A